MYVLYVCILEFRAYTGFSFQVGNFSVKLKFFYQKSITLLPVKLH